MMAWRALGRGTTANVFPVVLFTTLSAVAPMPNAKLLRAPWLVVCESVPATTSLVAPGHRER